MHRSNVLLRTTIALALAALTTATGASLGSPPPAGAQPEVRPIVFPVEGKVTYVDSFGAPRSGGRSHLGVDMMGTRLQRLLSTVDGTVTWMRHSALAGNNLVITDDEGWSYHYVHINNDSPGTDDGANPPEWAFAPGLKQGDRVRAGQHVAYLGDSGNAEATAPHLHLEIHRPDKVAINPTASVRAAESGAGARATAAASMWLADGVGRVFALGSANHHGDASAIGLNRPVVGMAPTSTGAGYWLLGQDGGVFAYGDARFHGSTGAMRLNQPVTGMAPTPSGGGYWLVASDGGIFSFGDAPFHGSTGAIRLAKPVNGMTPTPTGKGYWLVASDGGIFAFGDAPFHGSAAGGALSAPTVGIATVPDGSGYWIAASNGEVAAFGSAVHHGDLSHQRNAVPTARIQPTADGRGYWLIGTDGSVQGFGSAPAVAGVATGARGVVAAAAR